MSKFVYLSSENNPSGDFPNAEFNVNFSQPLTILPDSELRIIDCRINPKNDVLEINNSNNTLAFSIGYPWQADYDLGLYGGFYNVKLNNGIYRVENGDDETYFNFHLQTKMNEAITNNSLFRGGVTVSVLSSGKLNVKLAYMDKHNHYYENPTSEIPDSLLETIKGYNRVDIFTLVQHITPFTISKVQQESIPNDATNYYGVALERNFLDIAGNYFVSPPINLLGLGDLATNSWETLSTMTLDFAKVDLTADTANNYSGCFCLVGEGNIGMFPRNSAESLDMHKLHPENWLLNSAGDEDELRLEDSPIRVSFWLTKTELEVWVHHLDEVEDTTSTKVNGWSSADLMKIKVSMNNNLTNGKNLLKLELYRNNETVALHDQQYELNYAYLQEINKGRLVDNYAYNEKSLGKMANRRIGVTAYPDEGCAVDTDALKVTFAYDPQGQKDGFFQNAFQPANALEIHNNNDPIVPLVLYGNSDIDANFINVLINSFSTVVEWRNFGNTILRQINPNAGSNIGLDESGVMGTDQNLESDGIIFVDIINTNNRDTALMYVSLEDLPVLNYTGDVKYGNLNKWVYAIDFNSGSGNRNNIYTSKPTTEQFNKLTNQTALQLSNMRVRITNFKNQTVKNLDDYTYVVLEIRENPIIKQTRMLRDLMGNKQQSYMVQDQLKPMTKQIQ